jgi:hypothetical protein
MKTNIRVLKISLCGPSDVSREIKIAKEVITDWNTKHSDALNLYLKHQHWATDATPDLADRPQGVIDRQMIDDADIVVAIFWTRFGTPTGVAGSGTEEEIRRGITLGKRVMVYFSDLEPIPPQSDFSQLTQVNAFREHLLAKGLCWSFTSRKDFRISFDIHLARAVHDMGSDGKRVPAPSISQSIVGDNNMQIGGSLHFYEKPPTIKTVFERRPGSVSASEQKQIHAWIESLAEGTVGKTREAAFGEWWTRFHNRFDVARVEDFPSVRMPEVKEWHREQTGIQTRGLKTKAPDAWRNERIKAIKAAMRTMGHTNESYYPQVAGRLKMKKPFRSLKDLTKRDLDRVYTMALGDSRRR